MAATTKGVGASGGHTVSKTPRLGSRGAYSPVAGFLGDADARYQPRSGLLVNDPADAVIGEAFRIGPSAGIRLDTEVIPKLRQRIRETVERGRYRSHPAAEAALRKLDEQLAAAQQDRPGSDLMVINAVGMRGPRPLPNVVRTIRHERGHIIQS
ncbi:MAG: hypothetical protein ACR2NN_19470 [Bryobacteraceae bacterium]